MAARRFPAYRSHERLHMVHEEAEERRLALERREPDGFGAALRRLFLRG